MKQNKIPSRPSLRKALFFLSLAALGALSSCVSTPLPSISSSESLSSSESSSSSSVSSSFASLPSDALELKDFIDQGKASLVEQEGGYKEAPALRTAGTVSKILYQGSDKSVFYLTRFDPKTGETSSIRVENAALPDVAIGDSLSLTGNLRTLGEEYWLANVTEITNEGEGLYGSIEPLALTSSFEPGTYDQGLFVSVASYRNDRLLSPEYFDLPSSYGEYDYMEAVSLSFSYSGGLPLYPVLIDTRDRASNAKIYDDIVTNAGLTTTFSFKGNLRILNGKTYLAVSSTDDYVYTNHPEEMRDVNFYAINDFHGETDKIASMATYLRSLDDKKTAVFINSGDMWQGSLTSNYNYGRLLTQALDICGFDSFTLGNHEFDWGIDYIKRNATEYTKVPFLAANLYHWDMKTRTWGGFYGDFVKPYTIKDLGNGLRVGIIGVIGKDQITSISSSFVQDVGFKDPSDIVPGIAKDLREKENCDLVVLSGHADQDDLRNTYIADAVDAVFCGHTHQAETSRFFNGVPYIQGGSYGQYVSHIKVETINRRISSTHEENIAFNASNYKGNSEMKALVDAAKKESSAIGKEVLGTLSGGSLPKTGGMERLVCQAMAEEAERQGYTVDLALTNQARQVLSSGTVTYEKLYSVLPFNNIVYIADVAGEDLLSQAGRYGSFYRVREGAFEAGKTYRIAVIDYVLQHMDSNREYDYFPSSFEIVGELEKEGMPFYNYREVTASFFREKKKIVASDYTQSSLRWDKTKLGESVSF